MAQLLRVLIVDDSEDDAYLMERALQTSGFKVRARRVQTRDEMAAALDAESWDLVLSDYRMPRFDTYSAMALLEERHLDVPCIVVSGAISMENAVSFVKAGARDFVEKGDMPRLIPVIQRELALRPQPVTQGLGDLALTFKVLDHVSEAVALLDTEAGKGGRIIYANPSLAVLMGQHPDEIAGRGLEVLSTDEQLNTRLLQHLQVGQTFETIASNHRENQGEYLAKWNAYPLEGTPETRYWMITIKEMRTGDTREAIDQDRVYTRLS